MSDNKVLLCDFDGTLVNSLPFLYDTYACFLKSYGFVGTQDEFKHLNGPSLLEIVKYLKKRYVIATPIDTLYEHYLSSISSTYQKLQPTDGAVDFLTNAFQRHWRIVIVTSNYRPVVRLWLQEHKLCFCIHDIIDCTMVANTKPHPEPYEVAKHLFQASNYIAFEDSKSGTLSALNASIPTVTIGLDLDFSSELWMGSIPNLAGISLL